MQDQERLDNKRGIDKELQRKLAAKYDIKKAHACLEWVVAVTGKEVTGDFEADLKDGYLLCFLIKKISFTTYKKLKIKAKHTKQPFVCRTQIQNFVAGCKELGMAETDVCSSQDLYEGDNLNNVVSCLYALNAICYKLEASGKYKGPFLPGAGTKHAEGKARYFTEEELNRSKFIVPRQMQGGIQHESKTDHDAYGIIKTSQVSGAGRVEPKLVKGGDSSDGIVKVVDADSYIIMKEMGDYEMEIVAKADV